MTLFLSKDHTGRVRARLKWTDIDMKRNTIQVNLPEKNSKSGVYRVSGKLIAMLDALPKKSEKVFGGTFLNSMKGNFYSQKLTIARIEEPKNPADNISHLTPLKSHNALPPD